MTPYQKTVTVTTGGSNQIVAVPLPGRCTIDQVGVVLQGGGSVTADLYNRAFSSPAVAVYLITNDGSGHCALVLSTPLALNVGDAVTVAGSPNTDYNTTHRIMRKLDDQHYTTDQTFTVEAADGPVGTQTAALAIPSGEQPLYHVAAQITGTNSATANPQCLYCNQDPLLNRNIGVNRKIYVKLAAAGTYLINFRTQENVGW